MIVLVGSTKATTPPTESSNQSGSTLVIPVHGDVEDGDLLVAATFVTAVSQPGGWTDHFGSFGGFRIWSRLWSTGDPTSYTWTTGNAGSSRSGVMIVARGAQIGDKAIVDAAEGSPVKDCPTVTAGPNAGAVFLSFASVIDTAVTAEEEFSALAPMILQTQHASDGSAALSFPFYTVAGVIEGLDADEVVSGQKWIHSGSGSHIDSRVASLILDRILSEAPRETLCFTLKAESALGFSADATTALAFSFSVESALGASLEWEAC